MKCEVCGCENKENALFCAKCGKALKEEPIALDLQEIKVPAASRKARIVKVNTKKSADGTQQAQNSEQAEENMVLFNPEKEAVEKADEQARAAQQAKEAQTPAENTDIPATDTEMPAEESDYIELQPTPKPTQTPADTGATMQDDPTLAPMKIKNWIPVFILSAIPVVNLIMLLVWSFSSRTNKSKQSFARLCLICTLILVVLAVIAAILMQSVFHMNFSNLLQGIK